MFDKKTVMDVLSSKPIDFRNLVRKLGINHKQNKDFSKFLFLLIRSGEVFSTKNREYYIPDFDSEEVIGELRLNSKGFGFLDIDEEHSVFIPAQMINGAMNNDKVILKTFNDPDKIGEKQGVVKEVLSRSRKYFVGRVIMVKQTKTIVPFDPTIKGRFVFENPEEVQVGHEVKVSIVKYGSVNVLRVFKILGFNDDVAMDILVAIEDANIRTEFNEATLREAKSMPEKIDVSKDIADRVDLRNELIVTIDGDDTKDFDDAIHVKKLDNGNYVLGVHIADVTHYVKEGMDIDAEASKRGTSVYLADRVIPMLPIELSNGICSLNPNVDRLTISAEMEIDNQGNTVDTKIYESVINSKFRLTYKQVNEYYRDNYSWDNKDLHHMLDKALEISKIIRRFKEKEGYIDFEIEESKIVLDEKGKTKDIVARDRLESEMMIEDFMVRANEEVALFAASRKKPFIYRIHDKPDLDKVKNLQNVTKILGMSVSIPQHPIPSEFAKAVNQIKETRFDNFMKIMMLRTMAKAVYSPDNIGHFGLASKTYTHFTSPIRRYPDLMVHRMLRQYFFEKRKGAEKHFEEELGSIAEHSSETEQTAMNLERKVDDIKKAEFYEHLIGKSFTGTIVSVMKFGFFVEFPNKVDGLVHYSNLIDGTYKQTDNGYGLTNGTKTYMIGDKIDATVVQVNKIEGKIDLVPSALYQSWLKRDKMLEKNKFNRKK